MLHFERLAPLVLGLAATAAAEQPVLRYVAKHEELKYTFGGVAPTHRIKPGTRIISWSEDCYDGGLTKPGQKPSVVLTPGHENPQTGPSSTIVRASMAGAAAQSGSSWNPSTRRVPDKTPTWSRGRVTSSAESADALARTAAARIRRLWSPKWLSASGPCRGSAAGQTRCGDACPRGNRHGQHQGSASFQWLLHLSWVNGGGHLIEPEGILDMWRVGPEPA